MLTVSVSKLPRGRNIPGAQVTQFDDLKERRLPNWGRWGRQDDCIPRVGGSLSSEYVGDDLRDGEDAQRAVEARPDPIDWRDAEDLDQYIGKLAHRHREAIRARFYKHQRVPRLELDWAIRMLQDAMGQLEAVNDAE